MAKVSIEFERTDHLDQYSTIFDEEARASLTEACLREKAAVQRNSPRFSGAFASSIEMQVGPQGGMMRGDVFSTDSEPKVAVIESGRRPGGSFPNISTLSSWAQGKGIPVFLAARAIAIKGITPRRVFGRSADETEPEVDRILTVDLPESIIEQL